MTRELVRSKSQIEVPTVRSWSSMGLGKADKNQIRHFNDIHLNAREFSHGVSSETFPFGFKSVS